MMIRRIFIAVFASITIIAVSTGVLRWWKSQVKSYFDTRDNFFVFWDSNGTGCHIAIENGVINTKDIEQIGFLSKIPFCAIKSLRIKEARLMTQNPFPLIPSLNDLEISGIIVATTSPSVFKKSLENLLASPNLTILTLKNIPLRDEFLGNSKVIQVDGLFLDNIGISEDYFCSHFNLTNTSALQLANLPFTNKTLEKIATETQVLTCLQLNHLAITDDGLRYIPKSVTFLDLSFTKITDAGMKHLVDSIDTLKLMGTDITNQSLSSFPKWLRSLDLSNTSITNVRELKSYVLLERIYLCSLGLEEDALGALPESLKYLHLDGTAISDIGLEQILGRTSKSRFVVFGKLQNSLNTLKKLEGARIYFSP